VLGKIDIVTRLNLMHHWPVFDNCKSRTWCN